MLFSVFSCTDYVEGLEDDPDNLTDAAAKVIIQSAMLGNQFFHTSSSIRSSMLWLNMANGENRQYVALNNWNNTTASEFDDAWNTAYVNCLTQSRLVQQKSELIKNFRLKGCAQVIEAHCIGTVASLWGDIPYSQFQVNGSNLRPAYDNQLDVYTKLQQVLDQAIVNLSNNAAGNEIFGDIYYNGDASKWIKLAYSLKARFYLHVKNYPLAKQNALLGINSASDDFKAQFKQTYLQSFNPFYSFLVYDRDDYMSGDSYAARILDPSNALYRGNSKTNEAARFRFNYLTDANYFSPYELNYYCDFDWGATNGKFGGDSPMPMVTYGEMLLIIAEADARTSLSAGVTSYNTYRALLDTGYSIGITNAGYDTETFNYDAYVDADFMAGGMENTDNINSQTALLREIYQERYIYFIGSYEAYTDFGRNNNIAGIQLKPGFANTPQRFIYPQVEINSNGSNVPSPLPSISAKTRANNLP